jgi:hypothetical protein
VVGRSLAGAAPQATATTITRTAIVMDVLTKGLLDILFFIFPPDTTIYFSYLLNTRFTHVISNFLKELLFSSNGIKLKAYLYQ